MMCRSRSNALSTLSLGLVLAAAGAAGSAYAADMTMKAPAYKAVPLAYNWTGFYAGVDYAAVVSQGSVTSTDQAGQSDINARGLSLGIHAGYDWQLSPSWLVGAVADFGYLGTKTNFTEFNDRITVGTKSDWYGTVRARLGVIGGPSLIYVTGGAAFVHLKDTFGGDYTLATAPGSLSRTKTGWTVGAGIETRLSQHWTASAEYLYINAGHTTFTTTGDSNNADTPTFKNEFHVLKTRLSYRFGDGAYEGLPIPFINNFAPVVPVHNWAGMYAGINLGGALSLSDVVLNVASYGPAGSKNDLNGGGLTGGVQLGYNYMFAPMWMVGVEGDFNYMGVKRTVLDWYPDPTFTHDTNWLGTARVRVGRSTGPALFYLTAGGAWGHVTSSGTGGYGSISHVKSGWAAGGGTEIALNDRWAAKLEYLYVDLGSDSLPAGAPLATFHHKYQIVRAGLNYSFDMPLMAKN